MSKSYFEKYLNIAPFSLAIWRSLEANQLDRVKKKIKYRRPILDLGCGFGEFSGAFFNSSIEVGIDISHADLLKAAKGKKYQNLYVEDARKLSFSSGSFATIISISVLEHIPQVEKAIGEIFRVLKPGGHLIITVPLDDFYTHLFYPTILEKIGLKWLAQRYFRIINKSFKHINLWPQKKWEKIITKTGLEIIESKKFISKKATRAFDIFLISALPSQVSRWILGNRSVWGLSWKKKLLRPLYQKISPENKKEGCNLIIVAKKKST